MGIVHLIRHAEPEVRGVLLGRTDVALRADAIPSAEFSVATVFASPLRRARRTAELLFPNQPVTLLDGLAERDLGDWEGHSWSEVEHGWPDMARSAAADWFATTPPRGESWDCFVERVVSTWHVVRQAEKPIAVVAHVGVNAVLSQSIAGCNPAGFQQAYLEVLTLEFED
jgi:ribonuclease H / adenosylcobalamin/alpha-ribazole phosphatase